MFGDTRATTHDGFGVLFIQRSSLDRAVPWPHRAKVLLWTGLVIASWSVVFLAGYSVWSAL
jgi:hypothetical protein